MPLSNPACRPHHGGSSRGSTASATWRSARATFNYLVPLFAVLSGAVLLGERITLGQVAGGTLVIAGMIAVDRRSESAKKPALASEQVCP